MWSTLTHNFEGKPRIWKLNNFQIEPCCEHGESTKELPKSQLVSENVVRYMQQGNFARIYEDSETDQVGIWW